MAFGTINYFRKFHFRFGRVVDYLFVTDEIVVEHYEVLYRNKLVGVPLLDHFPVFIDFTIRP